MRIDIHTHVFNLRSIPARGVLRRWNVPSILAGAVAKLLLSMVEEDHPLARATAAPKGKDIAAMPADELIARIAEEAPAEIALDDEFIRGLLYLDQADITTITSAAFVRRGLSGDASRLAIAGAIADSSTEMIRLALADSQARVDSIRRLLEKVVQIMEGGAGALRFLYLMTRTEAHILDTYREIYDIDLNVHLMMGLEPHYLPDHPVYDYVSQQIPRMRELAQQSSGRMVVFAAFDPYRDNCQEIIEGAVERGGIGVKFYPPNGYRASGNMDGTYDGPPARLLDARNDRLFEYCADRRIPVFTHCTPTGFAAADGYGAFSDPKFWAPVLERHPTLILGFGHSGGAEGWFAPMTAEGDLIFKNAFAGGCFQLMKTYDNVYLDFGYLDDVFNVDMVERLRARITALVGQSPRLGDRFMYGSDWHMLYKEAKSDQYLNAFESVFTGALAPFADRFFGGNAAQFLHLEAFVARNHGSLGEDARTHLLRIASRGVQ